MWSADLVTPIGNHMRVSRNVQRKYRAFPARVSKSASAGFGRSGSALAESPKSITCPNPTSLFITSSSESYSYLSMDQIRIKHAALISGLTSLYDVLISLHYVSSTNVILPPHPPQLLATSIFQKIGLDTEVIDLISQTPVLRSSIV